MERLTKLSQANNEKLQEFATILSITVVSYTKIHPHHKTLSTL